MRTPFKPTGELLRIPGLCVYRVDAAGEVQLEVDSERGGGVVLTLCFTLHPDERAHADDPAWLRAFADRVSWDPTAFEHRDGG